MREHSSSGLEASPRAHRDTRARWLFGALVVGAVLLAASCELGPQQAFSVTTLVDAVDAAPGDGFCEVTPGGGDCSLRAAVQEANAFDGDTTITLAPGASYELAIPPASEANGSNGDLDITSSVIIEGEGATIDGGGIDRVVEVRPGASFVLRAATITGGVAEFGGGIANAGTTDIVDSTITGNTADGALVCGWLGCFDKGGGGGIDSTGHLTVRSSTISDNRTAGAGGCTNIIRPSCSWHEGGGVQVSGTSGFVSVTISGNEAIRGYGAGVAVVPGAEASMLFVTFADNRVVAPPTDEAGRGTGSTIWGAPELGASVVAGEGPLCSLPSIHAVTSVGYNLIEDSTCLAGSAQPTDQLDHPASLTALADNGGPTLTHLPGPALVDAVPPAQLLCDLLDDQRGEVRPVGGGCDIGAVERRGDDAAPLVLSGRSVPQPRVNEPYLAWLSGSGGTLAYSWTLTGDLPGGLVWDASRATISGVPHEPGTFEVEIGLADAVGATGTRVLTFVVDAPAPLVLSPRSLVSGIVGRPYDVAFTTSGGIDPHTTSVIGDLPAGVEWNDAESRLTGTPTEAGTWPLTITVTDRTLVTDSITVDLVIEPASDFVEVAAALGHSCGLVSDGTVRCWGQNTYGQLGSASADHSATPVPVVGVSDATSIAAGGYHSCALLEDATVTCWGYNASGQLGRGTLGGSFGQAAPVVGLTGVARLTIGGSTTCAITFDGSATCWGRGNPTPTAVAGLGAVERIATSGSHTCAITTDATLWCWGSNHYGQLGIGGGPDAALPTLVPGLASVSQVATGSNHTCATLTDGSARCWGWNNQWQLGDGSTASTATSPVTVPGITTATDLTATASATCFLLADGSVRCQGTLTGSSYGSTAVPVPDLDGVESLSRSSGSSEHVCAVVGGGAARCWGANNFGKLGDGTTTTATIPVWVAA